MRTRFGALLAAVVAGVMLAGCTLHKGGSDLKEGMTPDQAVAALGQPDLKDRIVDPAHHGVEVMRFVWLDTGKVAMFSPNNQVSEIDSIGSHPSQPGAASNGGTGGSSAAANPGAAPAIETPQEVQREVRPQPAFDPIETPFSYLFFPVRAAFIYIGAGLNCVAGGGCSAPELPSPRG